MDHLRRVGCMLLTRSCPSGKCSAACCYRRELKGCLLQYGVFEIALRHVKLNSLSIPKEDFAIVFTVALYEVNCFSTECVVSAGHKRHGRTSLAAILTVRRAV